MDKDSKNILKLAVSIYTLFFATGALAIYLDNKSKPEPQVTSGTFHMKFGGVMCRESYITECGAHLVKCDGRVHEYHCMHDVSFILDRFEEKKE